MKVIRNILYALALVLVLFCGFIIVCAIRPDITQKIEASLPLPPDGDLTAEPDTEQDSEPDPDDSPEVTDVVYLPQNEDDSTHDNDVISVNTGNGIQAGSSVRPENPAKDNTSTAGLRSGYTTNYIAPDESEIAAPDKVSGLSGYQQIEGDAQQIDDIEADDIKDQLDFGRLGDGLSFNAVFYPYYDMLDDTGKHIYRQVYANANAVNSTFMPVESVTSAQLRNIFAAVYNDHPELFWLETAYSCKYISSGQCVEIELKFNETSKELIRSKTDFNERVSGIVAGAQELSDNYEREKYVHDQLLEKVSYNAKAKMNQSAYSALVNGETVCAGYARAFQYILQQLGIPCYYCTGFAGENHAWNIVGLSDGYYNVDATWDDSSDGKYDYFNKNDEDYSSNHLRKDLSVYLPSCNGKIYRNLEQSGAGGSGSEDGLRSLADVGVSADQVISNMGAYYQDCYNRIVQNGLGRYVFYNVVSGEEMRLELYRVYDSGTFKQTYMESAVNAVGGTYYEWAVSVEELQGGMFLITHEIKVVK